MNKISLIMAQVDCGSGKQGADLAPDKLLQLGLDKQLNTISNVATQSVVTQPKDGQTLPNMHHWQQIQQLNQELYQTVSQSLSQGYFPLIIGGDHCIATGTVLATNKIYHNIGVIWVDAHGDWNNEHTTPSGNMHGMSFSAACGFGPDCMASYADDCFVDPHNCVIVGARDLDKEEAIRLRKAGVTVFTAEDVHTQGAQRIAQLALDVATNNTNGLYVSFDIDAVSPEFAPGTGTAVANGLTPQQTETILTTFAQSGKVVAMDTVEVNPLLDKDDMTSQLACKLILSAIGNM